MCPCVSYDATFLVYPLAPPPFTQGLEAVTRSPESLPVDGGAVQVLRRHSTCTSGGSLAFEVGLHRQLGVVDVLQCMRQVSV